MKITKKQLRKLITESIKPSDEEGDYEDNQTKMVRRYLIQLGIGDSFFDMNEEQIDSLAADLRLMSPSQKKLRDLYDLSVPTDIWLRNKNLGQTPDDDDEDPAYASEFGSHLDDDEESAFLQQSDEQRRDVDAMTGGPWYYEGDDNEDQ